MAAIVTACETVPRESAEAQAAREQAFRETLDTYKPASSDESAVIALLQTYRDAYNASDLSRIEGLLTSNFEMRYYKPQSENKYVVMLQDRSKYLKKRSAWSPNRPRQEKLIVNVRSVLLHPEGKGAVVVAATTYKSKYFHPRYIETYGFKRTSDGWLLRRILVVPAQPKPEELEVTISFARIDNSRLYGVDFLAAYGPDALFKDTIKLSSGVSQNRKQLIVLFAEPPAVGATIMVRERQSGTGREFRSALRHGGQWQWTPYFYILGTGWQGSGYSVSVEVEVDGVVIATGSP